jgi:manganese/zinc/iron transport system substrate-binding protein
VWLDASLWSHAGAAVADALAALDPAHAGTYRASAEAWRRQLLDLHVELQALLETIPREHRVLVTSHDAFRYFGRAYGLEVHGVQGISTVADAGIRDIEDIAELVVARGVRALFLETSIPPRTVEAVQQAVRARGGEVAIGGTLHGDALGDAPPVDTLAGILRANAKTIAEALR